MKTLLLPAALLLLVSCQPTGRKSPANETLTQSTARVHGEKAMQLSTSSGINEAEAITEEVKQSFNPGSKSLARFLKHFPKASMPLSFNSKTSKRIDEKDYISMDYVRFIPEMEVEQFSREVGKEYYYMAQVSESETYAAVVYAVKNVMAGENAPYGYVLASYNAKGKQIDKLVVGGQLELRDALCVGKIAEDGSIEVKEFKQRWEKNPEEEGYWENKVVSTSLKRVKRYDIRSDGHFSRNLPAIAMR